MIELRSATSVFAAAAKRFDAGKTLKIEPRLDDATDADREAARIGWAARVISEYRSVSIFNELFSHLVALEAPYPVLAAVHELIADELRHAALCARTASVFGSLDSLEIDLAEIGPPRVDVHKRARAFELAVRELVIVEGEALPVLRAYRNAATDRACRTVLSAIVRDEARHFAVGRALARWMIESWDRASLEPFLSRVGEVTAADVEEIRRRYARAATGGPGRAFGVSIRADELSWS